MTVERNVAYGLRSRGDRSAKVRAMLEMMRLTGLEKRYPRQLSGGQQQRVAIGRALMIQPRVLMLDEPFSALDTMVREKLQQDLVLMQEELKLTVLYVTHSLSDAFAMGHRIAVVNDGRIEQSGYKEEILSRPQSRAVARFTGTKNIFRARVVESNTDSLFLDWEGRRIETPPNQAEVGSMVSFCVRPENVMVVRGGWLSENGAKENLLSGRIVTEVSRGSLMSLFVKLEKTEASRGYDLEISLPQHSYSRLDLETQKMITVSLKKKDIHLIPEGWEHDS